MFSPGLKRSVGTILTRLGFLGAYAFLRSKYTGSQVAIIFYHRVSARKDCWSVEALDPDLFEGQIRYLCRNYRILSLRDLLASLNVSELPKKAVAICDPATNCSQGPPAKQATDWLWRCI